MLKRLLTATALILLVASRAQAAPINLLLTVDYNDPTNGPMPIGITYDFFTATSNQWGKTFNPVFTPLLHQSALVTTGSAQFNISLNVDSLDDVYFKALGLYDVYEPRGGNFGVYVAEPPTGYVSDSTANSYGGPWIPLDNLGDGFGNDFGWIFGYARVRGPVGTWELTPVPDPSTPVPEPATLLLFGSGLAAIARKKYLQSTT